MKLISKIIFCLGLLLSHSNFASIDDTVTHLPGLGKVSTPQYAGHLPIKDNENPYESSANLFYWFVGSESDYKNDPIVVWFNGGPGASGFYGFFAENGPYVVNNDLTLSPREFPWSKKVNYLIIEQASGLGLSYASPDTHLKDEAEAMDYLHNALHAFFKKHPEFKKNPLYLAGQSYAGKYIPQLAMRILETTPALNLKGILIGDGWVNPLVQQSANADYAYAHGLIDLDTYFRVQDLYKKCAQAIVQQSPSSKESNQLCSKMQKLIRQNSGLLGTDIRKSSDQDYSGIVKYLNQPSVREALHVDPRLKEATLFSQRISDDLEEGTQDSMAHLYPLLLNKGIRVLIYSGLDDGTDSNFMGTDKWLAEIDWNDKARFQAAPTVTWKNQNEIAGYIKASPLLIQAKIRGAGHLAPMDQPAHIQKLVFDFIFQQPFTLENK